MKLNTFIYLLSFVMTIFYSMGAIKPIKFDGPSAREFPTEVWTQIAINLIVPNQLGETVKAITSFAQTDRKFHAIINDPQNMKTLLELIAEKVRGNTIYDVAA